MAGFILPDLGISALEIRFLQHMLMALGGFVLPPKAESCTCIARDKFSIMSQSRTQPHGAWPIFCKSYMITDWFRAVVDTASPAREKHGSSLSSDTWVHWREQMHPGNLQQPGLNVVQAARGTLDPGLWVSLILWTLGDGFFYYMKLPSSAHISMCGKFRTKSWFFTF